MKKFGRRVTIAAGSAVLAFALYALMAAPGLLSDRDSIVPLRHEAGR